MVKAASCDKGLTVTEDQLPGAMAVVYTPSLLLVYTLVAPPSTHHQAGYVSKAPALGLVLALYCN